MPDKLKKIVFFIKKHIFLESSHYLYLVRKYRMLTEKVTIRLTPYQVQVLTELRDKLGCSFSLMIRTIVGDFLTRNEERIERLIESKNNDDKMFEDDALD